MNRIYSSFFVIFLCVIWLAVPSIASAWPNRPNVIRAAEQLAEEVEHLDEALHAVKAPVLLMQKYHHFEETVLEFNNEIKTCTHQQASVEMNHIRQDVALIRSELAAHPYLLQSAKVSLEWKSVRTAYRNLDHEMFHLDGVRWTTDKIKQLELDLKELDASHR